jgi:hypothetical protein
MPIGPADAVRADAHDRAVRRADWIGNVAHDERLVESLDNGCTHDVLQALFVD